MAPTLHIARLVLTPVAERDVTPLHAHWNTPQVAHWLWDGLSPFEPAPGIELLYSLALTHWSRGLVTEAATAVLAYAFDTLALPEVLATTDDGNHPSLGLLTRLGATPIQVGPDTHPCFRIQRPRYAPLRPL
jgi:RimJ/RimL family protein N-acetyltransferase